jgi:hypothetical protein
MDGGIFSDDEIEAAKVTEAPQEAPQEAAAEVEQQPEAAQETAPEGDAPAEGEAKAPPPGYVPHAALHAERQRVAELRARDAQREQRLVALEAMLRQQQAPQAEPSAEEDPVAALARIERGFQDFTARQQAEAESAQINAYVTRDIETFRQVKPDFEQAVGHLVNSRVNELRLMGYGDDEIREDIDAYDRHIATTAARSGLSVGEMLYNLATERGYRPAESAASNVTAMPQQPPASAKVAAIARGQASERSLGAASGGAPSGALDLRALLDLPDDEFAKIDASTFRKVAGG